MRWPEWFFRWPEKKNQAVPPANQASAHKVILVCFLKPGNPGGYEIRVIEEAKVLSHQGVEVHIAVFVLPEKFEDKPLLEPFQLNLEKDTGARAHIFPTRHFFDLHVSVELKSEIDRPLQDLMASTGTLILHAEALYAAVHSLRVAAKAGGKVVFDIHGALAEETIMRGGNPAWIKKLNETERELLAEVDACVMVSGSMRQFLEKKHAIRPENVTILPCCVHSSGFAIETATREQVRKAKGFDGKFVILYLGTLSVWQWPEAMFSLFSKLNKEIPESILYLLIPAFDQEVALRHIENAGIPPSSYVMEEVPHSQVGRYIGLADAGLLLRESHDVNLVSSPTKFGEYLAAGVPVILTEGIGDYSSLARELKTGHQVKIENNQLPDEELQALEVFCRDVAANRNVWAERCRQTAISHLEWSNAGKELIGLYKRLTLHGHGTDR